MKSIAQIYAIQKELTRREELSSMRRHALDFRYQIHPENPSTLSDRVRRGAFYLRLAIEYRNRARGLFGWAPGGSNWTKRGAA